AHEHDEPVLEFPGSPVVRRPDRLLLAPDVCVRQKAELNFVNFRTPSLPPIATSNRRKTFLYVLNRNPKPYDVLRPLKSISCQSARTSPASKNSVMSRPENASHRYSAFMNMAFSSRKRNSRKPRTESEPPMYGRK